MLSENYDVVIVGAGIGGLALGCALASNGRRTVILEARAALTQSKRGLSLQPNGLEALEKLGLLGQVASIGARTNRVIWRTTQEKALATLDYGVLDPPFNYLLTIIPSELELVLRRIFSNKGGVIHETAQFQELRPASSGRVTAKALKNGSPAEFSARVVVGADGENSRVRQALGIRASVKEYPSHFLYTLVGPAASPRDEAIQYFAPGKMVGFFPTRNSTYVFYYVPSSKLDQVKAQGVDVFRRELADINPELSDSLVRPESWKDVDSAAARKVEVESWVAAHAALLGDAAHTLDPSWAQGANLTLQDAVALAETLEVCFARNDFSEKMLKNYETMRRRQTRFAQQQAERTARLTTTESGFYHRLGKRVLAKTGRDRNLMRVALRASAGLTDYFSLREQIRFIL